MTQNAKRVLLHYLDFRHRGARMPRRVEFCALCFGLSAVLIDCGVDLL